MHRCLLSQYVKPMRHTAITVSERLLSVVSYARPRGGVDLYGGKRGKRLLLLIFLGVWVSDFLCFRIVVAPTTSEHTTLKESSN